MSSDRYGFELLDFVEVATRAAVSDHLLAQMRPRLLKTTSPIGNPHQI